MVVFGKFVENYIISGALLFTLLNVDLVGAQWCKTYEPVRKTRTVWRHRVRTVTKLNWFGFQTTESRPFSYTELENYYTYQSREQCCDGYTLLSGNCVPRCLPVCPANGFCYLPNICHCNKGYSREWLRSTLVCRPVCEGGCSAHSTCSAPNQCTCENGYEGNPCQPACRKRCPANSSCVAPERCECNVGYTTNETQIRTSTQAEADADAECQPVCAAGCAANSFCAAPNECRCSAGYKFHNVTQTCEPLCSLGCPAYSSCAAPEECRCNDGYSMNAVGTQCEPVCRNGCPAHSVCLRPMHCQCDEGYRMQPMIESHSEYCEPICEQDCSTYGKCVRPGVCECLPGYEMTGNGSALCQPRCSHDCSHGFCFAPEICVCDPGYLMGPNATCTPVCSLGCVRGKCIEPEICSCLPGYKLQAKSVNVCDPVCEPSCEHADCLAPNMCVCWNRYQPAPHSPSACMPTCPSECLHGYCNASFECSCHEGYDPHPYAPNECVPSCKHCQNGDCVEPRGCQCWPGYTAVQVIDADGETFETCALYTLEPAISTAISPTAGFDDESASTDTTITYSSSTSEPGSVKFTSVKSVDNIGVVESARCQPLCKCWSEFDDIGTINTARCQKLCADDFDRPCLNLTQCRCDLSRLQLLCYNEDESLEETKQQSHTLYTCVVRLTAPATAVATTTESARTQSEANRNASAERSEFSGWLIVLIVAAILAVVFIAVVWSRVHNRRKAEPTVGFNEDADGL